MKKKSLLLLPILLLAACAPQQVYVDKTDTNIIDDDYRNWYEIFVGSFYDSNGDGMGDLKGVESKLDYIKETGYNGIWLMPIFKSSSYHKYNTLDYYQIDPDYGTMQDLKDLIKACHDRDIRIILDLVINHSSRECEYFQIAETAHGKKLKGMPLTEDEEFYEDFYTWGPKEVKEGYTGAFSQGIAFSVESNFTYDMPEFNFDSINARNTLKAIAKHYLEMGVDGYRLDAVKYFYKDDSEKNAATLKDFHDYCATINEDVFFVGECWDSAQTIEKYYANSDCESYFWFPGGTAASGNGDIVGSIGLDGQMLSKYTTTLTDMVDMSHGHIPAPFLDNHDMPRMAKKDLTKTKFLRGLLQMMNGGTWTYYGDEIGLNGFNPPDEAVRKYMNWSKTDLTGICNNPAGAGKQEYIHEPLDVQIEDPNSLYNYEKHALLQRNRIPAIARGDIVKITEEYEEGTYCVIEKEYQGEKIGIIYNFSPKETLTYDLANTAYTTLEGRLHVQEDANVEINNNLITLPPYGIAIIK